jgi:hypothetical protein
MILLHLLRCFLPHQLHQLMKNLEFLLPPLHLHQIHRFPEWQLYLEYHYQQNLHLPQQDRKNLLAQVFLMKKLDF